MDLIYMGSRKRQDLLSKLGSWGPINSEEVYEGIGSCYPSLNVYILGRYTNCILYCFKINNCLFLWICVFFLFACALVVCRGQKGTLNPWSWSYRQLRLTGGGTRKRMLVFCKSDKHSNLGGISSPCHLSTYLPLIWVFSHGFLSLVFLCIRFKNFCQHFL